MGAPSVKVGTAPDTPPRGQVLARHLPPDRPYGRAGPVTLRQLSGSPPPLRVHRTRGGCGEPEADGVPRRATPAVWARSETPAPAMESGLAPRLLAAATGQASSRQAGRAAGRGTGDSPRPGSTGGAKTAVSGPADSPGRDTGSNRPHARPEPAPWEGPLVSDTTELFTGSSGTPEASPSGPDSGPSGAVTPAGETVTDKPTRRGGSGLSGMLLADLQRIAQEMGITGTGRMRKGQLVEAIQARQAGGAAYASSPGRTAEPATASRAASLSTASRPPARRLATGAGHTTTQSSVARLREPAHLASVSRTPWSQTHLLSPLWATPGTHLCRRRKQPRQRARRSETGPVRVRGVPRPGAGRPWPGRGRPARVRRAGGRRGGPERPGRGRWPRGRRRAAG